MDLYNDDNSDVDMYSSKDVARGSESHTTTYTSSLTDNHQYK